MCNAWPFGYYNILKNIEYDIGISFYYDIDKDEIYEKSELENYKNYRKSDRYLISGSKDSIDKLYQDIKNNNEIIRPRKLKLNVADIIDKYNKYMKKRYNMPNEIWLLISSYSNTYSMFKLCKTCNKLYTLLLNDKDNMVLHQFTLRKNVLNLKFIENLSYKIQNLCLNASEYITDDDFQYLKGIHTLNMGYCDQETITDKAFENLKGIHTLNMSSCNQETITDNAFKNLKGIHALCMYFCKQKTITDKAFEYLQGIHTLNISFCDQITDKAFENLKGIHYLNMSYCGRNSLSDKAFENLKGIHTLEMAYCYQNTITDKAFENLQGIHTLDMSYCNQNTITDNAFKNLKNIYSLDMEKCDQITITYKAFKYLQTTHYLNISHCNQISINQKIYKYIKNIPILIGKIARITKNLYGIELAN